MMAVDAAVVDQEVVHMACPGTCQLCEWDSCPELLTQMLLVLRIVVPVRVSVLVRCLVDRVQLHPLPGRRRYHRHSIAPWNHGDVFSSAFCRPSSYLLVLERRCGVARCR